MVSNTWIPLFLLFIPGCVDITILTPQETDLSPAEIIALEQANAMDTNQGMDQGHVELDLAQPSSLSTEQTCILSDSDGDGFGTHPQCMNVDCNDQDPLIFPNQEETCNGSDDDCDGHIDEGVPILTCGRGACTQESRCQNGIQSTCVPNSPQIEVCNGVDDNCDGEIDNVRPQLVDTLYSQLRTHHPQCDGRIWSGRIGFECNSAIFRLCSEQSCQTAGFGPLENFEDNALIMCMQGANFNLTLEELQSFNQNCNASQRTGLGCSLAIHKACQSFGHLSGIGPLEGSSTHSLISCLPSSLAVSVPITYSELSNYHSNCEGSSERWGPYCHAAIHRYCSQNGYRSGFGPVSFEQNQPVIVCTLSEGE